MSKNVFAPKTDPERIQSFVMAKVKSISGGKAELYIEGESDATQKKYKVIKSVSVSVGNRVLCARVSDSYVVIGVID